MVSTPVSIVSAIANAARHGVLIKGGVYLEQAGSLKAVAFDKTGTLTRGEPVLTDVLPLGDLSEQELLQMAASLEAHSEHPLAVAVVRGARERGLSPRPVTNFCAVPGRGARGDIDGATVSIGNVRFFQEQGISSEPADEQVRRLQDEGKTVMIVATEK